ncbi:glycosyltransferase family 4 protein [Actinopolymorpha alba]|uniref:glycosyltransferase family 4 protein n=1 Tax=Actinopolymorpha alba TaxID=533267 RepID=UPI000376FE1D|nr:glycosyltransferase family 4 protein [Actinopolymorpha alba]
MTEVLLITGHPASWSHVAEYAERLATSGFVVRIASAYDPRPPATPRAAVSRRLRMSLTGRRNGVAPPRFSPRWSKVVVRNLVVRGCVRVGSPAQRTWLLARYDPWFRSTARNADIVLVADDEAAPAARHAAVLGQDPPILSIDDPALEAVLIRARAAMPLQRVLRTGRPANGPGDLLEAWKTVESHPGDPYLRGFVVNAVRLVQALRRTNVFEAAEALARSAINLSTPRPVQDLLRLELLTSQIAQGEYPAGELATVIRDVLSRADDALRDGRTDEVAQTVLQVVEVVFHRELHADVLSSPLVSNPVDYVAPLYDSLTFRTLGARAGSMEGVLSAAARNRRNAGWPEPPAKADAPAVAEAPPRVRGRSARLLVVTGDYPHFTEGIIRTLEDDDEIDVRVLRPRSPASPPRRTHRHHLITDRLDDALGRPVDPVGEEDAELLGWADTIFVDWCDNAAQWVALHAPARARLVVRFHSLEAISHQPHMIDWSRVSDVIFVGHHVRQVVERAVPGLVRVGRIHVVPNEMRLERFGLPKPVGAERTIAMVGWAQRVKDPLWALEVLARLRGTDPLWRLLLIGRDFSSRQHLGALRYRDEFRDRARADDVRDGLEYVGYTADLPEVLRGAGFILSASRREGFPVGTTEGAASGAVPVIRDWPMYAGYDGARGIFPAEWVVDSPDEAAARILAYADLDKRDEAGRAARKFVVERFDWSVVRPRFRGILLGR